MAAVRQDRPLPPPEPQPPDLPEIRVDAAPESFATLLQAGFQVFLDRPRPLPEVLTAILGVTLDFAQERIQTIFLDGSVIDDLACPVCPGGRLALSAALPGLVGATMRRGGFYARLREGISRDPEALAAGPQGPGYVDVRLFNVLAREMAAPVLGRGIVLPRRELERFVEDRPELAAAAAGLAGVARGGRLVLRVCRGPASSGCS